MEGSQFVRQMLALPMDAGDNPQMWLWSAERLFYGGHTLWTLAAKHSQTPVAGAHPAEPGQFPVALLLFGYAIENGLKGLVIQRHHAAGRSVRNENGKLVGIPTKGHTTVHMARTELNGLAADEEDLLARLATYVHWAGRYPTMLELNGLREGQLVPTTAFHPETDRSLIEQVFEKIRAAYEAKFVRLSESR